MSNYIAPRLNGFAENLALYVRKKIYRRTIGSLNITRALKVIDLGVTSDNSKDSNYFEKLYPYPERITAVGLENAKYLEESHPGLKFVKADVCNLPFSDKSFDIAFCSAVIEHVGETSNQIQLITEAIRISRIVIIATPNKHYPIEFHTLTPLLHWLPNKIFRNYLRLVGKSFWACEENLNLLTDSQMKELFKSRNINFSERHVRLLGIISNLVYILESE